MKTQRKKFDEVFDQIHSEQKPKIRAYSSNYLLWLHDQARFHIEYHNSIDRMFRRELVKAAKEDPMCWFR